MRALGCVGEAMIVVARVNVVIMAQRMVKIGSVQLQRRYWKKYCSESPCWRTYYIVVDVCECILRRYPNASDGVDVQLAVEKATSISCLKLDAVSDRLYVTRCPNIRLQV